MRTVKHSRTTPGPPRVTQAVTNLTGQSRYLIGPSTITPDRRMADHPYTHMQNLLLHTTHQMHQYLRTAAAIYVSPYISNQKRAI
jgi:hypothetical protein